MKNGRSAKVKGKGKCKQKKQKVKGARSKVLRQSLCKPCPVCKPAPCPPPADLYMKHFSSSLNCKIWKG